jgi:hypothetical protein
LRAMTSTVADTTGYVGLAAWILDGRPADMHEVPWRCREFPVGYPCAIAALCRCGLAVPHGLLALNFICLAIGVWASWTLLRRTWGLPVEAAWGIVLLVAASTVCGELAVSIASEMLFFAAAMMAIERGEGRGKRAEGRGKMQETASLRSAGDSPVLSSPSSLFPLPSALLCFVAISVRTAGVALIPALLFACARHPLVRRFGLRRTLAVVAVPAGVALWFGVARILRSDYFEGIVRGRYSNGAAWDVLAGQQLAKLSAFGELMTNLRAEDFRAVYRGEFIVAGLICLALFVTGFVTAFWSRRRRLTALDIYLAAYAAIIFVYPYFSTGSSRRFWFPVLPFLFGLAYLAIDRLRERSPAVRRFAGPVLAVYLTLFVLFGCYRSLELSHFARHTDKEAASALAGLAARN